MTFINILIVATWKSRQAFRAYGWGNIPLRAVNYLYLTIMWWERTQFSNSTFWRLVFSHSWFRIHLQLDFVSLEMNYEPLVWEHQSHSWFRIHLQLDFVSLEMNYEPLVWEHQSPKYFGGEPTIPESGLQAYVCGKTMLSNINATYIH